MEKIKYYEVESKQTGRRHYVLMLEKCPHALRKITLASETPYTIEELVLHEILEMFGKKILNEFTSA